MTSLVRRSCPLAVVILLVVAPRCCFRTLAAQSDREASMQIPSKIPAMQLPFSQVDRQIDFLGAESNIQSNSDAQVYIDAILAKYHINTASVPGLAPLMHRLAKAEYSALGDPSKRIPESLLTSTFNGLMDEWGEEPWTRITVEDFHGFHRLKAGTLIPYSVSRNADGSVADSCRPVEAVYLLYLLSIERAGVSGELRNLPATFGRGPAVVKSGQVTANALGSAEVIRRREQYLKILNAWLQSYFNPNPSQEVGALFGTLHIGS